MTDKISTQKAEDMLNSGWILKTYKNSEIKDHSFYLWDPTRDKQPGSAQYITSKVFRNLLKKEEYQ